MRKAVGKPAGLGRLPEVAMDEQSGNGPDPHIKHPVPKHARLGFLKPLAEADNVEIGEYTVGDRRVIGRFCAIAEGVRRNPDAIRGADIERLEAAA